MRKRDAYPLEVAQESDTWFQNFYRNVATQLDVDAKLVVRVALGKQRSRKVAAAIELELKRIAVIAESNRNGRDRHTMSIEETGEDFGLPVSPELPICHAGAGMAFKSGRRLTRH